MTNEFPRKEVYVHTTQKPLISGSVEAVHDRDFSLDPELEEYSNARWNLENVGWKSSKIPTMVDISSSEEGMTLHCGVSSYKYMLGMVKLAQARGESDFRGVVHGLSTEVMPIFSDDTIIFEQRQGDATQHAAGFYDIPSASQNAEMYIEKANELKEGLVKDIFDMQGFPRFHISKAFPEIKPDQINDIFYVGFSRGFEVSLDTQVNGYTQVTHEGNEVMRSDAARNRLVYRVNDLPELLDTVGSSYIIPDIRGIAPQIASQTGGFTIVDDCLGTLLSTLYHRDSGKYQDALTALEKRGYKINKVDGKNTHLDDLK